VGLSQEDVLIFLKKHEGKWFSATEITDQMGFKSNAVRNNLSRLRKTDFMKVKMLMQPVYPCRGRHKILFYSYK